MDGMGTLPETNSSHLKMNGWNTFSFPFGARPIFRGKPLVSGSVWEKKAPQFATLASPGWINDLPSFDGPTERATHATRFFLKGST